VSKKKTAKKATKAPKSKAKTTGKKAKPAVPAPAAAAPAPPPKPTKINISAAKGRPMLTWVGKRPLAHVTAFPAQLAERHDALRIVGIDPQSIDTHDEKMQLFQDLRSQCNNECWKDAPFINGVWAPEIGGLLLHGDNRDVLGFLLLNGYRGRVSCIYIDPPFDSAADYVRRVNLRGAKGSAKVSGADYTLGEQIQYSDIWVNDAYLQFMFERLLLMRELLAENGSFFLHADAHRVHHLRALLDEVFGADAFRNQISWKRTSAHGGANRFGAVTDFILFYGKGPADSVWNPQFQEITQEHKERHYRHSDERGVFALGELTAPGITNGPSGQPWRGFDPRTLGRHWAKHPGELDRLDSEGFIYWPATPGAWPRLKRYWTEHKGRPATDFWDDIDPINMVGLEREDYPTQKPEALVERILHASTNPGDLVLDCFIGSGTTAAVAQKLGRRWIGCDINKGATQTTVKRLRGIIAEQIASARKAGAEARQGKLMETGAEGEQPPPKPCAFGFTVWRVNDYDLQIQHNEAVNLACEHIGIARTRSDSYFEGTLGKKLVKIIPFGHPLTPLDVEELKRELDARPDEDRNIVVVCLGMELAAKAWIDDWNRLRKGKDAVNKIDAIELRTDPKYGRFIKHEPASARVKVSRRIRGDEARIVVEIQDFISPTIVERLRDQAGLLAPKIDDWRAMVDCVYIDTAYNGSVLNVALADVPERKSDFVEGKYDMAAPEDETTVAVKIVDMLGEEVLVTEIV
jgi:adenine-specific DNA-methyltransferase